MMRIVCLQRQGLGDLHELLIADAELAHRLPGMDVTFQLHQELGGSVFHRPVVEQTEEGPFFTAEEDVGRGGKVLDQVQLLMNDADARFLGVACAGEAHRLVTQKAVALRSR